MTGIPRSTSPTPQSKPAQIIAQGRKKAAVAVSTAAVASLAVASAAPVPAQAENITPKGRTVSTVGGIGTSKAYALFGRPASGKPWHSGFWTGTSMSTARTNQAASWVGRPFDFVTTYPGYGTWSDITNSEWAITLFDGFNGKLSYGLPLLPMNRRGQWADINNGSHDYVFRTIARQLKANGRANAAIRVGVEVNGDWFPWGVTTGTASQFRAAYQRVVRIMNAEAPQLTFWFDLSSGYSLPGQTSRTAALSLLYPGDAYVDGISIDHYDAYYVKATTNAQFAAALFPKYGVGLGDVARFARARGKAMAVPEWGLDGTRNGGGDNPFFIRKMHEFFNTNRDVLAYECYFNEPQSYIANAVWGPVQMPNASATYRSVF